MEVLLVTFRCSIEVYISYWKPNKSFYYEISNIAAVNNELCGSLSKGEQKRGLSILTHPLSEQCKLYVHSPLYIEARLLWKQTIGGNGS